ncbi:MAG TPA: hypothetical protein PLZ99_01110 [Parcubacteria group bacterium]|jgi:pyruvoyl-dependent arginine decarboxylase (PvlArgDC)|nr:hypothetical protein [Parcubacteria group bacterium]
MPKCDYILTKHAGLSQVGIGEIVECCLEKHHSGNHLGKLQIGGYISWCKDDECGCNPEDGYCECILYSILTKAEADKTMRGEEPA